MLEETQESILIEILCMMYVDKWHVKGHTNELCINDEKGLLNPYLKRFKGILHGKNIKSNDQVCEQNWKIINRLKFAKNFGMQRFRFMLLEFRNRHNKRTWKRLVNSGYEFVDISKVSQLRTFKDLQTEMPTMEQLLKEDKYQKLKFPVLV